MGRRYRSIILPLLAGGTALAVCLLALPPAFSIFANGVRFNGVVGNEMSQLSERTVIYDSRGQVIGRLGLEDRSSVALSDVAPVMVEALLTTEDREFYGNAGVDLHAVARAFFKNVNSGSVKEGGSTLTQQLVKNRFFTSPQRTLSRKVREAMLSLRLDSEWPKNRILSEYLNTVYFGQGSYGIQAASERFFQTIPQDLNLAQAALLAGSIRDPEGNNPFTNPKGALERRSEVLGQMYEVGAITKSERTFAEASPLPDQRPQSDLRPDNYYVEEVQRRLLNDPRLADTREERYNLVFRGGLQVETPYDQSMQAKAQSAVNKTIPTSQFTAAMAVMDPSNGEVKALVAGPGFERSQFNLATQGARQPGSTFKAITLAAALENGYSVNDSISGSSPCTVKIDGFAPWTTRNAESGGGVLNLRSATEESVNCAFARLIAAIGPKKVSEMARRLGVTHEVPAYPSITLGTIGVSPLEMATVYSTLAAEGIKHDPVFITKLRDRNGRVIFEDREPGKRVLSAEVARTETSILQGVIRSGTGTRARLAPGDRAVGKGKIERFSAGKTGTTDDKTNAWFVGYTPELVAAVWMGDPAAYTPMTNVGKIGAVYGGTYPAMIWKAFMDAALRGKVVREFAKPNEKLWPTASSITEAGRGARLQLNPSGATGPSGPSGPEGPTAPLVPSTSTTLSPTTTSNPPTTSTIPPPL